MDIPSKLASADSPDPENPALPVTGAVRLLPLERLGLPAELDGCHGSNRRTTGHAQISAQNDLEAIGAWLARFADTPTTHESYRKDAERLLLWAVVERGKPLSSLTHEDLLAYQHFLADPRPSDRWVMAPGRKWSRQDPAWRPFAGPLAATSQRQAMVVINTLFSWLVSAGYLAGNPLALSRHRQRKAQPRIVRFLEDELWEAVKHTITHLPQEDERDRAHYHRARWLFSLLYLCGLRISEVVENTMGAFFCRRDEQGRERWWVEITGKGQKTRLIPATPELMAELAHYRRHKGFSPCPLPGDLTPLLLPVAGKPRPLTRSAVHLIVKEVFARTATSLREKGPQGERLAAIADAASAHWLRHTAGSAMANTMDLRHVRDNLGHASIATTNAYLHTEDDARHRETEEQHRLGW